MGWRSQFTSGLRARALAIPTVAAAVSDRVLPGASHEELDLPAIVYEVKYSRDPQLDGPGEWRAEVVAIVWHADKDACEDLADALVLGMEGINLNFSGVKVPHWRVADIESFEVSVVPGRLIQATLLEFDVLIDLTSL